MAAQSKRMRRAMSRLDDRRQEAERRLTDVRTALDREVGWAPKARVWVLPLVAFACGLAIAAGSRRQAPGRELD